ncbi:MAG TPA: hypothetical protein VHT72_08445 [Puia sp.]|nr:hypothetical protein [Puia sp.]
MERKITSVLSAVRFQNHIAMSKFLFAFLLISECSCGQQIKKPEVNHAAIALNDSAMDLIMCCGADENYRKAATLLDSATTIDSNYFLGYANKLICLGRLKEFKKAIVSVKNMMRIRPVAPDLYATCGFLYESTGDSASAGENFKKALILDEGLLDTMSIKNRDYDMLCYNKAVAVIMTGDQAKGNKLLKALYDRQTDNDYREMIGSMMNKSKRELVDFMIKGSSNSVSGEVSPNISPD